MSTSENTVPVVGEEEQPSKKQKVMAADADASAAAAAAAAPAPASSPAKAFVMQTDLVEAAENFVKTAAAVRVFGAAAVISFAEAQELWTMACDGPGVTHNEFSTLRHILDTYKFTDKARRYLTDLAVNKASGKGQYKTINKVKYDRSCLDLAAHLLKDGKIDLGDAKQLWEDVEDGPGVTEVERRTIVRVMETFTLTDGAKDFLVGKMREKMGLKLQYFNGRGLMEVPRTLLATVGKFAPADFEDARFGSFGEFAVAQKTGELGHANMNRVPLCTHFGTTVGQGPAINRYLAKTHGLMGARDTDAAHIDNICEHVGEIGRALDKHMPYGNDFSDEKKAGIHKLWFETSAAAGNAERKDRMLRWYLTHLEQCVGDDGYAFGGSPSLADALLYNKLGESCANLGDKGGPFGAAKAITTMVLEDFPKIKKIVDTFGASAGMVQYLAARGDQAF